MHKLVTKMTHRHSKERGAFCKYKKDFKTSVKTNHRKESQNNKFKDVEGRITMDPNEITGGLWNAMRTYSNQTNAKNKIKRSNHG